MQPVVPYSPAPARGWLPWVWLAPILMILFNAVPVVAMDGWMQARHWSTPTGDPIGLAGLHALLWIGFAPTLLVVLAWVRFVERRSLATIGLVGLRPAQHYLRGFGIGMAMIVLLVSAIWAAGGLRAQGVGVAWGSTASLASAGALLFGFAFQAGTEELIFRGWLLSTLARKANVVLAVVLVSLVFTLLHYSPHLPLRDVLMSFLFSLFACAWALRQGHVWGVMGWHTGWNWLLATGFELPVTGIDAGLPALLVALRPQGPDALSGGTLGPEGSWLCSLLFTLALIGLASWRVRKRRSDAAPV